MRSVRRRGSGYDVLVIGGGIAGLTAAWAAARRGFATALLEEAPLFGGQVANVEALEGFPTVSETSGTALASALVDACRALGVVVVQEAAKGLAAGGASQQVSSETQTLRATNVVVASGGRLRALGVPGEEELRGRGVSQCAPCDGPLFRGEDVVVVGGGDAALQEALVLAGLCRSVTIVCRGALRARRHHVDRVTARPNVRFVWESTISAIIGAQGGVEAVRLRSVKDGAESTLACAGIFPFIGSEPNTAFLPDEFERDEAGRLRTDPSFRTSLPGIWAVGAVRAGYSGELAAAAGEGAAVIAGIAAIAS